MLLLDYQGKLHLSQYNTALVYGRPGPQGHDGQYTFTLSPAPMDRDAADRLFPGSRFILTTRDKGAWLESVERWDPVRSLGNRCVASSVREPPDRVRPNRHLAAENAHAEH